MHWVIVVILCEMFTAMCFTTRVDLLNGGITFVEMAILAWIGGGVDYVCVLW